MSAQSEEILQSPTELRQELEQTKSVMDRLDHRVTTLSQDVDCLRADVKTILHLLQSSLTPDEATIGSVSFGGCTTPPMQTGMTDGNGQEPPPGGTDLSCTVPVLIDPPSISPPTTGILKGGTNNCERSPPAPGILKSCGNPGDKLNSTPGILKTSGGSGEKIPPANRVGFIDHPSTYCSENEEEDRDEIEEEEEEEDVEVEEGVHQDTERPPALNNLPRLSSFDSVESPDGDPRESSPLLGDSGSWSYPHPPYSPLLPKQNSTGASSSRGSAAALLQDFSDDSCTNSSIRGDSGIDMGRECETESTPFPKFMTTDL